jgi:hypothetical protein
VNSRASCTGGSCSAIISFVLIAAAIYFVVVLPMNHMIERRNRRLGINQDVKEGIRRGPADCAAHGNPRCTEERTP